MRNRVSSQLYVPILLGTPTVAQALSCAPPALTLDEAYQAADAIVVGLISECATEDGTELWVDGGQDCWFSAVEILKDAQPSRDYGGVASSDACGLSLKVGQQYLLFLDQNNEPMRFSAPLAADMHQAKLAQEHLRILRDFRSDVVQDLAEPWMFDDSYGGCSIRQTVKGNVIQFSRRNPDRPQDRKIHWTEERQDGNTIYKAAVPVYENESQMPAGVAEIVSFDEVPDDDASLSLRVTFKERASPPLRRAVISVGDKTWPLHRFETSYSLPHVPLQHKEIVYYAAGNAAEQVLAAMVQPSGFVVSATLVEPSSASARMDSSPAALESSVEPHFGPEPDPRTGITTAASKTFEAGPPSEPVLHIESRSTQIAGVIENFKGCG